MCVWCRGMAVVAALLQPLLEGAHPRAAFTLRVECLAAAARGMPSDPVLPSEPGASSPGGKSANSFTGHKQHPNHGRKAPDKYIFPG